MGCLFRVAQRVSEGHEVPDGVTEVDYDGAELRLAEHTLVIDEARQLSICLAVALSVATAAVSVILLGDPQQLTQPIQGGHPEGRMTCPPSGAETSAPEHLLGSQPMLPPDRGPFLPETFRMAPQITSFISRCFYEGRLQPHPDNAQALAGTDGFDGAGLSFVPVAHEGRDGTAREEVAAVRELLERLLIPGARFRDRKGRCHRLGHGHVMVCAPYNRHVDALQRGRANVPISRAQARAILVATPGLFETVPATPDGMRLVNAHVRLARGGV